MHEIAFLEFDGSAFSILEDPNSDVLYHLGELNLTITDNSQPVEFTIQNFQATVKWMLVEMLQALPA